MRHDRANSRIKLYRLGVVAGLALATFSVANAQSIMRSPTITLRSRTPTITMRSNAPRVSASPVVTSRGGDLGAHVNPGVANHVSPGAASHLSTTVATPSVANRVSPGVTSHVTTTVATPSVANHVSPGVATHLTTTVATPSVAGATTTVGATAPPTLVEQTVVRPQFPYLHTSPNLYPACQAADRGGDGDCIDPFATADAKGSTAKGKAKGAGPRRDAAQAAANLLTVTNEIVAEIDGTLTEEQASTLARRHGLRRVGSQNFSLLDATIGLFRITDGRSFETASRDFASDVSVRSVQPNYRYFVQDQNTAPAEGDPAQYVLAKMRLPQAHTLARGTGVKVAIIDSGIDVRHRELAGSIVDSFDALDSSEGPHVHGTGIAGAIAAHARLMGSAPKAQLIAIRAFSGTSNGAQSNSYIILKSLDYAFRKQARIINMSFAGPQDPLIERGVNAVATKGIAMVAAAGNGGPKSPPLYPAANPNVIAVSAIDAQDHLFAASNRGSYVALSAPGSDVFLPAPDGKYQLTSGTSFSAAYVSGLAALMLERNLALQPLELRAILLHTARDLGSPGRDDLFGAGEADALSAVEAVIAAQSAPEASTVAPQREVSQDKLPANALENGAEQREIPPVRALTPQIPSVAADKSTSGTPHEPAAQ